MSFTKDDSFGPGEDADMNENISFESNNRPEDLQLPKENLNSNRNGEYLCIRKLIYESLNANLTNIFRIIKYRTTFLQQSFFLELIHLSDIRKINKFKAEIIYANIVKTLRSILRIYKKRQRVSLFKIFIKWSSISQIMGQITLMKSEIEKEYEKRMKKELTQQEEKMKDKENEISELRKTVNNLIVLESDVSKKIKAYEEKTSNFVNLIKQKEEEKKGKEEELKTKMSCKGDNTDWYKVMEEKIREYEGQICSLQEENREKDYSISLFLREMGEMLQAHEKNFDLLSSEIEEEDKTRVTSLKQNPISPKNINISNMICFTSSNTPGGNRQLNQSSNYSFNPLSTKNTLANQSSNSGRNTNAKFSIGLTKNNYYSNGGTKK